MNSFCAMNSFRMSFWSVPRSDVHGTPCRSATTRYIASSIGAGRVDRHRRGHRAEIDAVEQRLHVGERHHADAALAHLAERQRVVRVAAHQRRQIERDAEAGAAGREQRAVAQVGVRGRAEARRTAASSTACRGSRRGAGRACTGTARAAGSCAPRRDRRGSRACTPRPSRPSRHCSSRPRCATVTRRPQ